MFLVVCAPQIHDGRNASAPAFPEQPRYYEGSWTRPVIAATSKYVFLKFTPGPTKGKTFVGFKASYWTVQSEYKTFLLQVRMRKRARSRVVKTRENL